jgi:hypothetical protein
MGWNTTVVVLNDALNEIEQDPEFGKKIKQAATSLLVRSGPIELSAGRIANAASVIESHPSDMTSLLAVGGNRASRLHMSLGWKTCDPDEQLRLLRDWADAAGYRLVKKVQQEELAGTA